MRALLIPLVAVVTVAALPRTSSADSSEQIPSALTITKSSNKNEVQYAVDVTNACRPAGPAPVHAYWRMLEKGPNTTEPLSSLEQKGFGVGSQSVEGDTVRIVVRGLSTRPITIHTYRAANGQCAAESSATIGGVSARISNVFVKLGLFGLSYVQLSGFGPTGGFVSERVSP